MTSNLYRSNFEAIFGSDSDRDSQASQADSQPAEQATFTATQTVERTPEAPVETPRPKRRRKATKPAATDDAATAATTATTATVPVPSLFAASQAEAAYDYQAACKAAERYEAAKEEAKRLYAEADRLMVELHDAVGLGGSLVLPDGRTLTVVDNFRDANGNPKIVAFRPCGVKLYDVKIK